MEADMQMTQLNVRVPADSKRQAEDVLRLMGTTTTELVRKMLGKVARGAKNYAELMAVLEAPAEAAADAEAATEINPVVVEGWAIVDEFCRTLGYESADDVPIDTRSWDERYEEAMVEHYREKGWIQ